MDDIFENMFMTSDKIVDLLSNKLISQLEVINNVKFEESEINNGVASRIKHTNVKGFDIYYEDDAHVYYIIKDGVRLPLISVTTLIGLFNIPFDTYNQAIRCANKTEYDCNCLDITNWDYITIDERTKRILKAWDENNRIATEYGTAVHMACEYLANNINMDFDEILDIVVSRCGDVLKDRKLVYKYLVKFKKFLQYYLDQGFEIITEPVVVDLILGSAGQSDLILIHHEKKIIKTLDHKTNAENPVEEKAYNKMRGIFSHLDSYAYTHYCIQIPYYSFMLKQIYKDYTVDEMTLLWFNEEDEGYKLIPIDMDYWNKQIQNMREYFIKHNISKRVYDKIKEYNEN
jgi:hypothetical protein